MTGLVGVSAPASAATTCKTLGHAYYIEKPSGATYFSGFEGDVRYGVPKIRSFRGAPFELGGNGIKPGTRIHFVADSGLFIAGVYDTSKAGSNCVVDQTKNRFTIGNVPLGTYRVRADYEVPGRQIFTDPVVDVEVVQ